MVVIFGRENPNKAEKARMIPTRKTSARLLRKKVIEQYLELPHQKIHRQNSRNE